ncbi:MAG: hypothetical protein EBZ77_16855 [Chitinophagia bacterium]|nr:hypothetical protein [Chitinophagia bacterium]
MECTAHFHQRYYYYYFGGCEYMTERVAFAVVVAADAAQADVEVGVVEVALLIPRPSLTTQLQLQLL